MSDRSDFIADKLAGFLARRSVPRHLKGHPDLITAESDGLNRTILRYAPTQGLEEWWETFEENLLRRMKTQTWPIVSEVEAACQAATPARDRPVIKPVEVAFDAITINANRMNRGEAVSEHYLYGREAVELERRGLVPEEVIARYLSALFLSRQQQYGKDAAHRWEIEARAGHERAARMLEDSARQRREERQLDIPDMSRFRKAV